LGYYAADIHPDIRNIPDIIMQIITKKENESIINDAILLLRKSYSIIHYFDIEEYKPMWEIIIKKLFETELRSELEINISAVLLKYCKDKIVWVLGEYREKIYKKYCLKNQIPNIKITENLLLLKLFIKKDDFAIEIYLRMGILEEILNRKPTTKLLRILGCIMKSRPIYLDFILNNYTLIKFLYDQLLKNEQFNIKIQTSKIIIKACEISTPQQISKIIDSDLLYYSLKNIKHFLNVDVKYPKIAENAIIKLARQGYQIQNSLKIIKCLLQIRKIYVKIRENGA